MATWTISIDTDHPDAVAMLRAAVQTLHRTSTGPWDLPVNVSTVLYGPDGQVLAGWVTEGDGSERTSECDPLVIGSPIRAA